jgi:Protein of unknown function (DUF4240)
MSDEGQFIPPMPENRFWALVEQSNGDAGRLKPLLIALPAEDICAFSLTLDDMMYALDRRDIHDVADGSNDGFEYVRLWIISRGRAYYKSVVADPRNAPQWADDEENEDFGYVAGEAYKAKIGASFPQVIHQHRIARFGTHCNTAGWADSD